ncbi:MAG: Hpt domain-containing protein, partial [Aeromonas sobria]
PLLGMARIRQLVGLFESQGRVLVDELAKGEVSKQRQLAHKLKGSALALGLSEFAGHCATLEAGGGEPAAIGPQFEAAVSGLQQWLAANRDAPS